MHVVETISSRSNWMCRQIETNDDGDIDERAPRETFGLVAEPSCNYWSLLNWDSPLITDTCSGYALRWADNAVYVGIARIEPSHCLVR